MMVLEYLRSDPSAFVWCTFVLGLIVGSFLNVVVHRLPIMMEREWQSQCRELLDPQEASPKAEPYNLVVPRSRCPRCGHAITAWENIPVVSYLALRGRCSQCSAPISARYPLVELLTGALSAGVAWHFGLSWPAAGALAITWSMIAASFIDFDKQLIPDSITLPVMWAGMGASLIGRGFVTLEASVLGAMAGYAVLWTVFHLFRLLTGKEGMGYGDFKLLALLGAWLGWQALPVVILLASALGAVVGITLIVCRGHDRNIPIPFGPYLAGAGYVAMLWGPDLTRWYLG